VKEKYEELEKKKVKIHSKRKTKEKKFQDQ